jgi:Ca2+-binding RTX toxin-like protein
MLTGDGGANIIYGGVGNDIINGGAGADQLFGDSGVDIINGGAGQDVLTGGGSGDRFVFSSAADSAIGFDDSITDFHHTEKDRIDLSGVYSGTFSFIGSSAFSGHAGELAFSSYASGIIVAGDIDGDGHADFEIKLIGASAIEFGDFFL